MKNTLTLILLTSSISGPVWAASPITEIPGGNYVPFVLRSNQKKSEPDQFKRIPAKVDSFLVDQNLVTNADFLKFVRVHAEWRRSKVKRLFADQHYLQHWKSDTQFVSKSDGARPVTNVSWFAAKAFCESRGMDLPTSDQWEYIFFDRGRDQDSLKEKVLTWYSEPTPRSLARVGTKGKNNFGVYDLSSIVWEWTLDFNSFLAGDELRATESKDSFCGGGSLGRLDSSDYAAFMRYSFRASLKANYTTGNLGFRCDKPEGNL